MFENYLGFCLKPLIDKRAGDGVRQAQAACPHELVKLCWSRLRGFYCSNCDINLVNVQNSEPMYDLEKNADAVLHKRSSRDELFKKIELLNASRATMLNYLDLKVTEQDWHGVADAAMDLRDLDEFVRGLKESGGIV